MMRQLQHWAEPGSLSRPSETMLSRKVFVWMTCNKPTPTFRRRDSLQRPGRLPKRLGRTLQQQVLADQAARVIHQANIKALSLSLLPHLTRSWVQRQLKPMTSKHPASEKGSQLMSVRGTLSHTSELTMNQNQRQRKPMEPRDMHFELGTRVLSVQGTLFHASDLRTSMIVAKWFST